MEQHRCEIIEERLEQHLNKYADNNKELLRLAIALENITKEVRDHHLFSEENKKRRELEEMKFKEQLAPILLNYNTIINGRKWLFWLTTFSFSVGSLYLLVKQIFHK